MSINTFFSNYFVEETSLQLKLNRIAEEFGDLPVDNTSNKIVYGLYRLASKRPLCYINRNSAKTLIQYFTDNTEFFLDALRDEDNAITPAIFSLLQEAPSWNYEVKSDSSTPNGIKDFELIWHPEYVRYFEHIYKKFIRIPLGIIERKKHKKLRDAKTHVQIDTLNRNGLSEITKGSSRVIRNAISHGKVYYDGIRIKYVDLNETEEVFASEMLRNFDHLVENCNSIISAILITLANIDQISDQLDNHQIPFGILYLIADGLISHDDFQLEYAYENIIKKNTKQLHVACKTGALGRTTQIMHAINVAWKFQTYFKSYDRYAFSIECGKSLPNSLFLNGNEIQKAMDNNVELTELKNVIDTNMLWFGTSAFKNKYHNRSVILRISWRLFKQEYFGNLEKSGLKLSGRKYEIRNIENKSAGNIRRVKAQILLKAKSNDFNQIKRIIRHAVRKLRRKRFQALYLGKASNWRKKASYVWIDIFTENKTIRSYEYHMFSPYYVLGVEWIRRRKNEPIMVKSPDMIIGKTRIKLNKKSQE